MTVMITMMKNNDFFICILAGGQARRLGGGDKALLNIQPNITILEYIKKRLGLHHYHWIINANDNENGKAEARFLQFNVPIIQDIKQGYHGPLMGILSAFHYNKNLKTPYRYIMFIPGDTPFIPLNFISQLCHKITATSSDIIFAQSHGKYHPVASLWQSYLYESLYQAVIHDNIRKIDSFTAQYKQTITIFDDSIINKNLIDGFFNINMPEDYEKAKIILKD